MGDSILGMVVAEYLYKRHPNLPEGELTRTRALLVCEESLVEVSDKLGLGEKILLGKGELARGARPSIRADVVEAVIAAIFLDANMAESKKIIEKYILCKEEDILGKTRDYKTALQEEVQKTPNVTISYKLLGEEGPDHQKLFAMAVLVNQEIMGRGKGKSKKEAEQKAAEEALYLWKDGKKPDGTPIN